MSTLRERLNGLKKKKGIKSDSELLKGIYQKLREDGKIKDVSEDEFVRKAKGSFSAMIDEKRAFDQDYFFPLEHILDTSMLYLIDGKGGNDEYSHQRGLHFAAVTDTKTNYQTLIDEGVYLEQDEYQYTLLDYMIENDSRNGFEFFAERGELPVSEIGMFNAVGLSLRMNQNTPESLLQGILRFCKPETALKYFDGYYFAERGENPENLDVDTKNDLEVVASLLSLNAPLRAALADYKIISLRTANPGIQSVDGKPLGDGVFVNFFLHEMVQTWHPDIDADKDAGHPTRELFVKAIEINEIAMEAILSLGYSSYRVEPCGFIYSGGVLCGSIVNVPGGPADGMDVFFDQKTIDTYDELCRQVQMFKDRVTEGNRVTIDGGIMLVAKQNNQPFYDFYRLMGASNVDSVAVWLEDQSSRKDAFRLTGGEQCPIGQNKGELFKEALKILSEIDAVSETALGKGKIYAFPLLTNRSFFVDEERVTGIAPTEVRVGERYDNLAAFIADVCLSIPQFYLAEGMVRSVAHAIKSYGVGKKHVAECLAMIANYYRRTAEEIDKEGDRGKMLIAEKCQRALWIELFTGDIVEQFK